MKIAYFMDTLPPHYDGVVNSFLRLIDTLEKENVDFKFISPFMPAKEFSWSHRVFKVFSVPFILYKDYRVGIPYFNRTTPELDQYQPDLVHVVSPTILGIFGLKYAKRRKIPVVSSYHTNYVSYLKYYGFPEKIEEVSWDYFRWFYNQFDRVYAPSPTTARELQGQGIIDVDLWQRGVNLDSYSPDFFNRDLRRSIGAEEKPILLFVGRLVKEKDLDDLCEACSLLRSDGMDFKLVIVGEGPMRDELEERIPDAHFTGFLKDRALSEWYATADLFVFPSTTETFGNVILEAFASGTPAVVVNKGGQADIINEGYDGLMAEANRATDFSIKIAHLLKNPELRRQMAQNARKTALQYSWEAINTRLLRSYETVISRSK
ncbi:MAG: glycosyltransferase family 1 protein [Candidatus Aminicenantes bacterium]|nr:glycosyltransferase family 1 protein [Candidatus Aminicenantes bacterium]